MTTRTGRFSGSVKVLLVVACRHCHIEFCWLVVVPVDDVSNDVLNAAVLVGEFFEFVRVLYLHRVAFEEPLQFARVLWGGREMDFPEVGFVNFLEDPLDAQGHLGLCLNDPEVAIERHLSVQSHSMLPIRFTILIGLPFIRSGRAVNLVLEVTITRPFKASC